MERSSEKESESIIPRLAPNTVEKQTKSSVTISTPTIKEKTYCPPISSAHITAIYATSLDGEILIFPSFIYQYEVNTNA
jgi:hypothetical protein